MENTIAKLEHHWRCKKGGEPYNILINSTKTLCFAVNVFWIKIFIIALVTGSELKRCRRYNKPVPSSIIVLMNYFYMLSQWATCLVIYVLIIGAIFEKALF